MLRVLEDLIFAYLDNSPERNSQRFLSVFDSKASNTAAPISRYVKVHTTRDRVLTFCLFIFAQCNSHANSSAVPRDNHENRSVRSRFYAFCRTNTRRSPLMLPSIRDEHDGPATFSFPRTCYRSIDDMTRERSWKTSGRVHDPRKAAPNARSTLTLVDTPDEKVLIR